MSYKEIFGIIASGVAVISYIPYFKDIFEKRTKPHVFSWLVWSLLTVVAFFAQIVGGAGPGAWVNGFTAVICFFIFIFGLRKGKANIVFIDWISLIGAGIAFGFLIFTKNPLISVILVTVIDALGYFPTFRKSYHKPHEETLSTYVLSALKYVFALVALQTYSLTTMLFPLYLVVADTLFVVMIVIRKKQLRL